MAEQNTTTEPKRYAAYDLDELRFIGGVHDSETKARDAGKAVLKAEGSHQVKHRIEVREL